MARHKKKINLGNKIIRNSRNRNSISMKIIKKNQNKMPQNWLRQKKQDFFENKKMIIWPMTHLQSPIFSKIYF